MRTDDRRLLLELLDRAVAELRPTQPRNIVEQVERARQHLADRLGDQ